MKVYNHELQKTWNIRICDSCVTFEPDEIEKKCIFCGGSLREPTLPELAEMQEMGLPLSLLDFTEKRLVRWWWHGKGKRKKVV